MLLAAAQIALPLVDDAVAGLTTIVVVALTAATYLIALSTWRAERLLLVFVTVTGLAVAVEAVGSTTGLPFGAYSYENRLQPQILEVPAIVALAWFAMGLPALEIARQLMPGTGLRRPARWLVAGACLAAWDLFLDPQMVAVGFWTWADPSGWHGIPWTNYLGWLMVGTALAAVTDTIGGDRPNNLGLILIYGWMALMQTMGFLLPFVFDRPPIAIVGGLAMGVPLVLALTRWEGPWPSLRS